MSPIMSSGETSRVKDFERESPTVMRPSSLQCLPWESRLGRTLCSGILYLAGPLLRLLPYLLPSLQWFQLAGCGHSSSSGRSYWGCSCGRWLLSLRIGHWRNLRWWGSRRALVTRASPDLPPPSHWFWHLYPIVWIGTLGACWGFRLKQSFPIPMHCWWNGRGPGISQQPQNGMWWGLLWN